MKPHAMGRQRAVSTRTLQSADWIKGRMIQVLHSYSWQIFVTKMIFDVETVLAAPPNMILSSHDDQHSIPAL
jgi:hypothetical protein